MLITTESEKPPVDKPLNIYLQLCSPPGALKQENESILRANLFTSVMFKGYR